MTWWGRKEAGNGRTWAIAGSGRLVREPFHGFLLATLGLSTSNAEIARIGLVLAIMSDLVLRDVSHLLCNHTLY
jgi:hypothetical protein